MLAATDDYLSTAIEHVRPMFADTTLPWPARLRLLWAAAKNAREYAASDVWEQEFMWLANDCGLLAQFGRHQVQHVLAWAYENDDPPF